MTIQFNTKSISPNPNWDKTMFNFNTKHTTSDSASGGTVSGLTTISAITFTDKNCYLDTGIKSAKNDVINIKMSLFEKPNSFYMLTNGAIVMGYDSSNNKFMLSSGYNVNIDVGINVIYEIEVTNTSESRTLKILDKQTSRNASNAAYNDKCPIVLGGQGNSGGTITQTECKCNIYEYKYYRDGVLMQHLQPCLDKNGTPCFHDVLSGQVLYNTGTGDFGYIQ